MHARTYFPYTARFLSPDPGRDYDLSHPQSFNLYAYVRNNPMNAVDPWGLESANSPTASRRNCDPDGRGNVECQGQQGFPREQAQASAFLDEKGAYHESVTVWGKSLPTGMERLTATWPWLFDPNLAAAQRPPEMRAPRPSELPPPPPRERDYRTKTVCVGPAIAVCFGRTTDVFQRSYFSVSLSVGKSLLWASLTVADGAWEDRPAAEELEQRLSGWSASFGFGALLGFNFTAPGFMLSRGTGENTLVLGVGFGVSGGYTWRLP